MRTQGIGGRIRVTLASIAVIVAACSGSGGGTTSAPASAAASASAASAGDPTSDKLAQVKARGTLVLWTDPDYAPQSMKVDGAARAADTKCGPNEMTGPEMTGYDAETGKAVAAELGVEPCFVVTPFDAMIAELFIVDPRPSRALPISLGTIQTLLASPSAIFGIICRYW